VPDFLPHPAAPENLAPGRDGPPPAGAADNALSRSREALQPLLLPAGDAARLCGISEVTWYRLKAAGKLPQPVRLGGRVLWRLEELRDWIAAGCPAAREWAARRAAGGRR
jgi:predicted DNA-binding transcriptional regulator AlpA